ncbi:MAG: glycosyl hydrolase family 2 [Polyangiaceae bacterium]|nr:glycosyl hydrolase family 2 [Polyangiaceae bacterium]MCB9608215.1 glycosyl hydrolase family 2 [Polyangiaceae bacterium]
MNNRIDLNAGWHLGSSARVGRDGRELSTSAGAGSDELIRKEVGWLEISMPCTVLGALVDAGVYPEPFVGKRLLDVPGQGPPAVNFSNHDMPEDSPFAVPWWYRTTFETPPELGERVLLGLDGLNYRGSVWINGELVADEGTLVGAYRDYVLDITDYVHRDAPNVLAISVQAPNKDDLAITWVDWNPSPPDKNLGLWREVWLRGVGAVRVTRAFVKSRVLRGEGGSQARLEVHTELHNLSGDTERVQLRADIAALGIVLEAQVELGPGECRQVVWRADAHPELELDDPPLWWPRVMGEQPLFELEVTASLQGCLSDRCQARFGIREVTSELTPDEHTLFRINGEALVIRGAGWATDLFLRPDWERDQRQIEYVVAMNLNTIRFEGMLERGRFLERCDELGLLVIAGWCCCDHWERWDNWKEEDYGVAAESLRSQLRRVAHHPSMLTWWYGSDFPPPPRVEQSYLEVFDAEAWPNCKQSSAANKPTPVTGPSGIKMVGPYEYVPPSYWLTDQERGGAFGFASEICPGVAVPPLESLQRMLPAQNHWPPDDTWKFHCGGQEFHNLDLFLEATRERLGEPTGIADFARKAQLLTYEGQRAMFEAYARNKYRATGVVQWMLNNAWPSLIWHLYDYYLRPAGGFFGTQRGSEPLHVLYGYDDHAVWLTSDYRRAVEDLELLVRVYGLGGELRFSASQSVSVGPDGALRVLELPPVEALGLSPGGVVFLDLELLQGGQSVSRNWYWIPAEADEIDFPNGTWYYTPVKRFADLRALSQLAEAGDFAADLRVRREPGVQRFDVKLKNPGPRVAFFVELRLCDADGSDVLPVLWEDNYVTLRPGEERVVSGSTTVAAPLAVEVSGFNVATRVVHSARSLPPLQLPDLLETASAE